MTHKGEYSIFDAHCHLGKTFRREWKATDLIQTMDTFGIDQSIVFPTANFDDNNFSNSNKRIAEAVVEFPDRLVGFARVNPHRSRKAVQELKRSVEVLELKGVKLHPTMEVFPANSRIVHPIMRAATELGIPVVFHSGTAPYALPSQIADIAIKFPRIPVIMAHMGKGLPVEAIAAAKRSNNLVLETSGASSRIGLLEGAVKTIGVDRIVFGSDWPCCHPAPEKMKIDVLELSEKEKQAIFSRNIKRILSEES
ncbi:MAG: amidohydrolase [Candidatus Bathyarchaeota archaeon]|nr:MAG: amidohydrolase [Candidatus Bathyarchaeota archaeon]